MKMLRTPVSNNPVNYYRVLYIRKFVVLAANR